MKVVDCEQGSAKWFYEHLGRVSGSNVADALSFLIARGDLERCAACGVDEGFPCVSKKAGVPMKGTHEGRKRIITKGPETAARAAYKAQKVAEILTGEPALGGYLSPFMEWGTEQEPFARAAYEVRRDVSVDRVGFVVHPTIERAGGSPDGLIGDEGGIEIKCPKTETHISYMMAGSVPEEYEPQIMFYMACTGRQWFDFVSFDPILPIRHQLFIKRLFRNEDRIAEMNAGVISFLAEADALVEELKAINPEIESYDENPGVEPEFGITDEDLPSWYRESSSV